MNTATPAFAPPPAGAEPATDLDTPAPAAANGDRNDDAWSQLDDRAGHLLHRYDDDERRVLAVLVAAFDPRRGATSPTVTRRWLSRHRVTVDDAKWWGLVAAARRHLDLDQAARRRLTAVQIGLDRLSEQVPAGLKRHVVSRPLLAAVLAETAARDGAGLDVPWTIPRAVATWNVNPHTARSGLRFAVANCWIADRGMRSQTRLLSLPRRRRTGERSNPDGWSRLVVDHLLDAPVDEVAEPTERRVAGVVATLIRHAGHPVWGYSGRLGVEHWEALLAASIGVLKLGDRNVHTVGVGRCTGIGQRRLVTIVNDWFEILGDSTTDRARMSDADGVLMHLATDLDAAKLVATLDELATTTGAVERAADAEQRRAEASGERRAAVSEWRVRGHIDYLHGKVGAPSGGDVDGWVERAATHLAERSVAADDRETTMLAIDQLATLTIDQRDRLWQTLGGKVEQSADGDQVFDRVIAEVGRCPTRPAPIREWVVAVQAAIGEPPPSVATRRRLRHRLAIEIAERRGASTVDARNAAKVIIA